MHSYRLSVNFDKLICHQAGSKTTSIAQPYMWCVFFKVDGESVVISDQFKLAGQAGVHFSHGSHHNLGQVIVEKGTTINIPPAVGQWNTDLFPMKLPYFEQDFPATIGLTCILLKQGNVSHKAIEAGHQKLNEFVMHTIEKSVADFDPRQIDVYHLESSVKSYFERSVSHVSEGVDRVIMRAVIGNQNILQNIRSLIKQDSLVGFKIWNFNHTDIAFNHGLISFSERWTSPKNGDWEVQGTLKAEIIQHANPLKPVIDTKP